MITIPEIVGQIVATSPFLEEALARRIVNHSSLARSIRPEIEKRLMKNVQTGAIVMAIRRLSRSLKPSDSLSNILHSNPDIIVRSNLIEYVVDNGSFSVGKYKRLLKLVEREHTNFMTITEGIFETIIIASKIFYKDILLILDAGNKVKELSDLSSVTIRLPQTNVYTPGLYYLFLKSLAWENINVIEVVSTYSEFTIILQNKEVDRAFSVLKKLFSENIT